MAMDEQAYRAFCEAWLGAWTGNAPEKLLEYYTDDVFYRDPARPDGLRGKEALRGYLVRLLAAYPDWRWMPEEIMPTAKGFTLKWRAEIPIKGQTVQEYGLDIVELRDGKISRNEVYFDPGRMA
jgi:ketosteroid isomerase-like protein